MMLLSDKAVSTLEAVLDIACNARPNPVRSGEVAARLGRPRRYLEKIIQKLAQNGILKGVRGPRGGYMLSRERRRIRVGEILRIVAATEIDNGTRTKKRISTSPCIESLLQICAEMEEDFFKRLDKITIEELCASHENAGQSRRDQNTADVDFDI